jgi:Kef-type K+ transport system membrane component KefB
LLGIFFITVGMALDTSIILHEWWMIALMAISLVAIKTLASFILQFTICHLDAGEILVFRALRSLVVRTSLPSG